MGNRYLFENHQHEKPAHKRRQSAGIYLQKNTNGWHKTFHSLCLCEQELNSQTLSPITSCDLPETGCCSGKRCHDREIKTALRLFGAPAPSQPLGMLSQALSVHAAIFAGIWCCSAHWRYADQIRSRCAENILAFTELPRSVF